MMMFFTSEESELAVHLRSAKAHSGGVQLQLRRSDSRLFHLLRPTSGEPLRVSQLRRWDFGIVTPESQSCPNSGIPPPGNPFGLPRRSDSHFGGENERG